MDKLTLRVGLRPVAVKERKRCLSPLNKLAPTRAGLRCLPPAVVIVCAICLILTGPRSGGATDLLPTLSEDPPASALPRLLADTLTTNDIEWVSKIDINARARGQRDTVPASQSLRDLGHLWHERFGNRLSASDSLPDPRPPVEELFARQIGHVYSILDGVEAPEDTLDEIGYRILSEARDAVHHLSNLVPLVEAVRDSVRSALLVISSVGCECELRRCEEMMRLHESLRQDSSSGPVTMVDVMQVPSLSDIVGPVDIPYWVLFDENGERVFVVGGNSDPEDVKSNILSWLGVSEVGQK